jgi:protein CpxP
MADISTNNPAPEPTEPPRPASPRRFGWIVVVAMAAGLTLGAAGTKAFSRPGGFAWHHFHGPMTQGQIEDRADRMVRHAGIELDTTAEQQEKLRAIVKGAVKDIVPMREKVHAAREQARKLLVEPNINRGEIERLRTEQVALADQFSRRITQALGDAGDVLTLEQRKKLDDILPPPGVPGPGRGWIR